MEREKDVREAGRTRGKRAMASRASSTKIESEANEMARERK